MPADRIFRVLSVVVIFVAAIACSRPASTEQFVSLGEKGEDGLYHFDLDFNDSTATYDLSFYSRIDCNNLKLSSIRDFPLTVTWVSPEGAKYSEKVYFSTHDYAPGSDFYSHQYTIPYRSGLVPVKWGLWELQVRIDSDMLIPGFRGLGVVFSKNEK